MKNTHEGSVLLVKLQALVKVTPLRGCFFTFFKLYKWYQIVQRITDVDVTKNVNEDIASNSKSEKPLGVTIDYKLTFDEHVSRICDKASFGSHFLFMKSFQNRQILKEE